MAKRVDAAAQVVLRRFHVREDNTGRSDGTRDDSGLDDPIADRAGRLIARACDYWSAFRETRRVSGRSGNPAADRNRFEGHRQNGCVDSNSPGHFIGPSPARDVEQSSSRSIGYICRVLAGQTESNVVFGKHYFACPFEMRRLVVSNPDELWQSEAGENRIGSESKNGVLTDQPVDLVDLGLAALIAPDQRGTNHLIGCIQHHEPMHLSGQANAGDLSAGNVGPRQHTTYGLLGRVPPVLRPLLRP